MGTSGQQHLHLQQQLQQQGIHLSQNISPAVAAIKSQQHVSVSRAHSFPKTSPLAMAGADYNQVRPGSQGINVRPPNVTISHASSSTKNTGSSSTSSHSHLSQNWISSSGASHSQSSRSRANNNSGESSGLGASGSSRSQGSGDKAAGRRSPSHSHSHSHSHSPRAARKAAERAARHAAAISGLATPREGAGANTSAALSASAPPAVTSRSSSHQASGSNSNPASMSHSMLTTMTTVTPPNKVVGASVDDAAVHHGAIPMLPARDRETKEQERREKDKEKVGNVKCSLYQGRNLMFLKQEEESLNFATHPALWLKQDSLIKSFFFSFIRFHRETTRKTPQNV